MQFSKHVRRGNAIPEPIFPTNYSSYNDRFLRTIWVCAAGLPRSGDCNVDGSTAGLTASRLLVQLQAMTAFPVNPQRRRRSKERHADCVKTKAG
ncbi:hypothetical protein [Mesorhizobium sp.]|uniref:hypothetical protein n=1 Tax=Mesorhizobium sp. TaxID=1871066 RepID=UPI000FE734F5|nr:hypothetical protein [Mesorhizobium sp.]RWB53557.1 MAG: hypothetical protein EOQ47_21870 [Mesorhizobium sp.]